MHLCQQCPCRVQGVANSATLLSVNLKTWTKGVREKACARNHSYNVNREYNTFADIIQHSTLTSRFHDTQTLQYKANLTIDKIQFMKLIKVQSIPLGVSFWHSAGCALGGVRQGLIRMLPALHAAMRYLALSTCLVFFVQCVCVIELSVLPQAPRQRLQRLPRRWERTPRCLCIRCSIQPAA